MRSRLLAIIFLVWAVAFVIWGRVETAYCPEVIAFIEGMPYWAAAAICLILSARFSCIRRE